MLRMVTFPFHRPARAGRRALYTAERSMALCPALAGHPGAVWGTLLTLNGLLFAAPLLIRLPGPAGFRRSAVERGLRLVRLHLHLRGLPGRGGPGPGAAGPRPRPRRRLGVRAWRRAAPWLPCCWGWPPPCARQRCAGWKCPSRTCRRGCRACASCRSPTCTWGRWRAGPRWSTSWPPATPSGPTWSAVTGDLVDGEGAGVRAKAVRLGALQATHGVFFVTGNHEYYSGVGRWLQLLRGLGWRVLDNDHALLEHRGALLAVAGMPDPTDRVGPDLARALGGIPAGATRVLLFHRPTGTAAAERAGVHLQLSGHTHAGQYFPWSLAVQALYAHPRGLGREGRMWIYTSFGTGFWGPPNRFLVPRTHPADPQAGVVSIRRPLFRPSRLAVGFGFRVLAPTHRRVVRLQRPRCAAGDASGHAAPSPRGRSIRLRFTEQNSKQPSWDPGHSRERSARPPAANRRNPHPRRGRTA